MADVELRHLTTMAAIVEEGTFGRATARLADAVERFKAGDGQIDIATLQSVSNMILPSVVRRLRDEHPGCEIRLSEGCR